MNGDYWEVSMSMRGDCAAVASPRRSVQVQSSASTEQEKSPAQAESTARSQSTMYMNHNSGGRREAGVVLLCASFFLLCVR